MSTHSLTRWRAQLRAFRALAGILYFPGFLSWKLLSSEESMRIRRWALASSYPGHPYLRWVALGVAALLWPVKSLFLTWRYMRGCGPEVFASGGKSVRRQALEQLWLAWTHSISPRDYYTYALHRPERLRLSTRFLYDTETGTLFGALNERHPAVSLGDKVRFAEHLRARGIPAAATLAWTQSGTLIFSGPEATLPPVDLFVKPVASFGGQGAMLWEHLGAEMYGSASAAALLASLGVPLSGPAGEVMLHRKDLCELLVRLSSRGEIMVQPRLVNHPGLADLSTGALLCARVLTGAFQGRAEFIRGVLKMPMGGGSIVVNFGIVAPIEERSGILGSATPFGPTDLRFSHHPETGAAIEGRPVPEWEAIKAIAVAAHHALPEYTFIGWDIALTPEGALVLEGNAGWGTEALQKPHGAPLLDTRFTPICLARIAQLRRSRGRRQRPSGRAAG